MRLLTTAETDLVKVHLAEAGLSEALQEELLDHLCCAIEAELETGASFSAAFDRQIATWDHLQLRAIQKQTTFITKTKPMLLKLTTFSLLFACLGLLTNAPADSVEHPEKEAIGWLSLEADPHITGASLDPGPPTASPLAGVALQDAHAGFGKRTHPISKRKVFHRGIDFKASLGTPVLATAPGTVSFAGVNGDHGVQVVIQHAGGYSTAYSHLASHGVEVGQSLRLGQVIAKVGTTGRSTGPHLHYEIRKDEQPINPLAMLER